MTTINYGASMAAAAIRGAQASASRSIGNLATGGSVGDLSISALNKGLSSVMSIGAKNLSIHAGRYEQFAAQANALLAVTQEMFELATKYSGTGYSTHEYDRAGAVYFALDDYRTDSIGQTAHTVGGATFATAKTEDYATGRAMVGGSLTRAVARGAVAATRAGISATVATTATQNTRTEMVTAAALLDNEIATLGAEVSNLLSIADAATVMSTAAGIEAAGFAAAGAKAGTDFAAETASLAANQIIAQAATAMVAQAGALEQTHLALLQ